MAFELDDIERLFESKGHEQYSGEPVTQLQHALQCAFLAEQEACDAALLGCGYKEMLTLFAGL